jgi:peptide/nickel transport system permease protein
MTRFVLVRVATGAVLLLVLSTVTFLIYTAIPVEPAGYLVDLQHATPEQIQAARHALGLDHSLPYRYGAYMAHLVRGDFGTAWSTLGIGYDGGIHGFAVGRMVREAAGQTASVIFGGAVVLILVAVPLALLSARVPRSFLDRAVVAISLVGISTHPLVIGLVLQGLFSVHWHLLDGGYCNFFEHRPPQATAPQYFTTASFAPCEGPKDWATHLILPWVTFALFFVALYMRVLRARLLETLGTHWVRTARAKGATEPRILVRHALPNVAAPVLVMLAMDAGTAIGISIYIEVVYGLQGIGSLVLSSLSGEQGYDLPLILGVMFISATAILLLNTVADILARLIDPRITSISRAGAGGARSGLA